MSLQIEEIDEKMAGLSERYASAEPFPHIVMDDFLPDDLFRQLVACFPQADSPLWDRYDYQYQTKLACNLVHRFPQPIRSTLHMLNSGGFLEKLEALTGEKGLVSDPYFVGGGIHQIQRGGKLAVHADFTQPPHLKMYRRLNLLIYLNPEWEETYGGKFELWDREAKHCVKSVAPKGNRCVIFTTSGDSFHGHPHPLNCPEGITRRSLAIYYYQLQPPNASHAGVVTRWNKQKSGGIGGLRNAAARFLWWVSYKFAGLAGRLDV